MHKEKMKRSNHESRQSSTASQHAKARKTENSELTSRAVIGQYSGLGPDAGVPRGESTAISNTIASKMSQSNWSAVESEKNGSGRAFGG